MLGYHSKLHERLRSGRLWFQSSLGKKFAISHFKGKKLGIVVVGTCHPSNSRKHKIGGSWSRPGREKN
jgi:hypothetical protein